MKIDFELETIDYGCTSQQEKEGVPNSQRAAVNEL
ncbi:hypothetical protein F441_00424 [Phytophthora nicotianae CJ01A1]|uniref:Uncharacterized protein n=3 Tax=Phytophthora nicotianae TaxID=4792 RepID=V9G1L1_PHYNI|nr:hypothetical protein F443_00429 [Phytophthora nicotianae P1569]ETK96994.1 hypothetical protein L915_00399 [Phytophthora nicotianae]ETP27016.1 hypothetical protein F441_00424 [Phytophthora nicotianae CJ01A1]